MFVAALTSSACVSGSSTKTPYFEDESLTVTFVGTGGPELSVEREGIATLITTGKQMLLVDVGRNTMQNLYEAGIDPREVTNILLTHLHNDHIEGLPTLWMTGWFLLGRTEPLKVWGPPGTQAMINGMYQMYAFDIKQRSNPFNDRRDLQIEVQEISAPGLVFNSEKMSVHAIRAEHDDGNPAFSYAVESDNHKILLTGDTRLFDGLIEFARDSDVLVSNILSMPQTLARKPEMQAVVAKLMTINEAASLFGAAKPRLAVYSHFVGKELPEDGDLFIENETRAAGYDGPLFLARDGWSVNVESLEIQPPPNPDELVDLDRKLSYED